MDVPGYALITGAASGIGRACALAFAAEGAAGVALLDVNEQGLAAVKTEMDKTRSCQVICRTLDVTDEKDVDSAVAEVASTFGRLDYVVNSAGIGITHPKGVTHIDTDDWKLLLDTNLNGIFYVLRAAVRVMEKQTPLPGRLPHRGSIVNIASVLGLTALASRTGYATSKHAVVGLTRSAARGQAKDGPRVNAVCPGYVETPMTTGTEEVRQALDGHVQATVPMKRWADAQEIADGVLYLAGGRSSYATGITLVLDGGFHT